VLPSGGASSLRMLAMVDVADWPRKGLRPVAISYITRRVRKDRCAVHGLAFQLLRAM